MLKTFILIKGIIKLNKFKYSNNSDIYYYVVIVILYNKYYGSLNFSKIKLKITYPPIYELSLK